ncbi:hypothetical protein PsorP6_019452 [Peronosclerospora sorghi]|nr:hypothetical protein PsorP6_019452 [Peronosclerospora sorghi]
MSRPRVSMFYGHMKRFLRRACWASHNERWRSYLIAKVVIELFTYHALHCQTLQCIVPMCRQLRGQVLPSSMNIGRKRRKRFIYNWPKCGSHKARVAWLLLGERSRHTWSRLIKVIY